MATRKQHRAEAYCVARRYADRQELTGRHRDQFFRMAGDLIDKPMDRRERFDHIARLAEWAADAQNRQVA